MEDERSKGLRLLAFRLALVWSGKAWAAKWIALFIIGDNQNPHVLDSPNPSKEAPDVGQALRNLGFVVKNRSEA